MGLWIHNSDPIGGIRICAYWDATLWRTPGPCEIKALRSLETLDITNPATHHYIPDLETQLNRCGNLKFHTTPGALLCRHDSAKKEYFLPKPCICGFVVALENWYTAGKLHSDGFRLRSDWFLNRIFSSDIVLVFCHIRHVDCLFAPTQFGLLK